MVAMVIRYFIHSFVGHSLSRSLSLSLALLMFQLYSVHVVSLPKFFRLKLQTLVLLHSKWQTHAQITTSDISVDSCYIHGILPNASYIKQRTKIINANKIIPRNTSFALKTTASY